jgi:hypothetical protein
VGLTSPRWHETARLGTIFANYAGFLLRSQIGMDRPPGGKVCVSGSGRSDSQAAFTPWLKAAFWGSLFVMLPCLVWTVHCGLESSRGAKRVVEAETEGRRLQAEAAKNLAAAEKELDGWMQTAENLSVQASKKEGARRAGGLFVNADDTKVVLAAGERGFLALGPQMKTAQVQVRAAKQAVDDATGTAARLVETANRDREHARQRLFGAMATLAASTFVTVAIGSAWAWNKRRSGGDLT